MFFAFSSLLAGAGELRAARVSIVSDDDEAGPGHSSGIPMVGSEKPKKSSAALAAAEPSKRGDMIPISTKHLKFGSDVHSLVPGKSCCQLASKGIKKFGLKRRRMGKVL